MRITFSPLIAGASGRAADAVAATWKGRPYIRKYVIPHNPKSAAQVLVRESLARCVTLWRSLGTEVKAWLDTYAVDYRMSGYNTFLGKNRASEQVPEALAVVPANPHVMAPGTFAGSVAVAEQIVVSWVDDVVTGFDKMFLCLRDQAENVFQGEILTVVAAGELYTFSGLTTGHVYDVYGSYYNATTGALGTIASDMSKTVT